MLWTMKPDGTDQKMLEGAWSIRTLGRGPLVSPDGERIVFAQANKSHGWAMMINADGSELDTLVTETPGSYVYLGGWSPDGGKLVYQLELYATPQIGVWVINPDGSGRLRLDEGCNPRFCGNDKVVYSRLDGIFVIGTNGEGKRRLQESLFGTSLLKPTGSPDGEKIAFCRGLVVPPPNQKCELEIINPDSSGQTRLADMYGLSSISEIEFSPDNKRILFLAARETSAEIYVVNIDGSGLRALTDNTAHAGGRARWSPDGSQIVFTSRKGNNQEIYTVNTSGAPQMRRLTDNPANDCNPDW
jgi:TolB protein